MQFIHVKKSLLHRLLLGAAAIVFGRRQKRATALEKEAEEQYEERLREKDVERAAKRSAS